MRILVLSDSHGNVENMIRCVDLAEPGAILHLGDCRHDAEALHRHYPGIPMQCVPGNCDWGAVDAPEVLTEYGGVRILMMHGHTRHVKAGAMSAVFAAREMGAQILLYGHTHQPLVDFDGTLWVMNPGSVGRGSPCTYGIISITKDKVDCSTYRI